MKNILHIIVLLLVVVPKAYSQKIAYTIVKAHGAITRAGKHLSMGDKILSTEKIKFDKPGSFIVAIDEKRSTWILRPNPTLNKFNPYPLPFAFGTKPGVILNYIQLVQFFNQNDSIRLLDGKFSLQIGKAAFPMNERQFFCLKPLWISDSVTTLLDFSKDTLTIKSANLFIVDETTIQNKDAGNRYALYYRDLEKGESTFINSFYLDKIENSALIEEVRLIEQANNEMPKKDIVQLINTFIRVAYGKVSDIEIKKWLNHHFNL